MSEWWTYRPSDFVMFSPRAYARLVERYNADVWPLAHVAGIALGLVLVWLVATRRPQGPRWACGLLALAWVWVGWAFHWQRFAEINTAAVYLAIACFVQAGLLLGVDALWPREAREPHPVVRAIGLGLLVFAVAGYPLLAPLMGKPWGQAEVFGVMPGATVVGTVGVVMVMLRWSAIALPIAILMLDA